MDTFPRDMGAEYYILDILESMLEPSATNSTISVHTMCLVFAELAAIIVKILIVRVLKLLIFNTHFKKLYL
jgi:hypothetical protein